MLKEYKAFEFKLSDTEQDGNFGYIEGYASTFGNVDLGFDVIEKGAFKKTIKDKKGKWPILLDHDPSKPAGLNLEAEENDVGLKVKGRLNLTDPVVRHRFELAKLYHEEGVKMGLSIGYSAVKWETSKPSDAQAIQVRKLKEVKLFEYSLVTFPMNDRAGTTSAKATDWLTFLQTAQSFGLTLDQIKQALLSQSFSSNETIEAAPKSNDPLIMQSLDKLLARMQSR